MTENQTEVSISDLFHIIFKNIYVIIFSTIFCLMISCVYTFKLQDTVYESTTSVMVDPLKFTNSNSNDLTGGIEASESVAKWFLEILVLDEVAENINTLFNTFYTSDEIYNMLSTKYSSSDIFVYLTCTSNDSTISKYIANEVISVSLELANENYTILENAYFQVSSAKEGSDVSTSSILIILIGTILGGIIGVTLAFVLYFMKNHFVKVDQIERETKENIIGSIYDTLENKKDYDILSNLNKNNYNKLLTNIDFSNVDGKVKTIVISSSVAKEGKSTTIVNLAKIMAENGRKVLIIDCDLRCPKIHRYLEIAPKYGLTDYITNQASLEETLINKQENLDVICAGGRAPNPIVILQSDKIDQLIEISKDKYDYILIDSPPILVSSDTTRVCHFKKIKKWL